ncbi:hypothetical protein Dimus_031528 [Dionaea muscipula]
MAANQRSATIVGNHVCQVWGFGVRSHGVRQNAREKLSFLVCASHGVFEEVFELFYRMVDSGIVRDRTIFTTILTACIHGGPVKEGKEYFEMMTKRFGIRPTILLLYLESCDGKKETKIIEVIEDQLDLMFETDIGSYILKCVM